MVKLCALHFPQSSPEPSCLLQSQRLIYKSSGVGKKSQMPMVLFQPGCVCSAPNPARSTPNRAFDGSEKSATSRIQVFLRHFLGGMHSAALSATISHWCYRHQDFLDYHQMLLDVLQKPKIAHIRACAWKMLWLWLWLAVQAEKQLI